EGGQGGRGAGAGGEGPAAELADQVADLLRVGPHGAAAEELQQGRAVGADAGPGEPPLVVGPQSLRPAFSHRGRGWLEGGGGAADGQQAGGQAEGGVASVHVRSTSCPRGRVSPSG